MRIAAITGTCLAALSFGVAGPASALSMKECSAKYQAAKQAGNAAKWNDFRKAECGADAQAAPPSATAATQSAAPATPASSSTRRAPSAGAPRASTTSATAAPPGAVSPKSTTATKAAPSSTSVAYPSAVDPKYAKESPGKARLHTCLDAYNAAKAAGTLGDTKWIVKGGGYYSGCNAKLKG